MWIFTKAGYPILIAVIFCSNVFCVRTHVCVCVSACLFQVMDTIDFGLHGANDSPKTAAPCEPHNEMPHESHRALTSDTMPHWENLSPSHVKYVAGYPQSNVL